MPRLAALPPLLRDEPALRQVAGRHAAVLAVPEAGRALTVAALAHLSDRRPIVVAVPTGTMAERLVDDLTQFVEPDTVELFPAWETLPFERVSPAIETMGRRLRVLWRLGQPDRVPRIIVASVRSLLQRLGPRGDDARPVVVTRGAVLDPDQLVSRLVTMGYRREDLV
ncbi:MAG TPA: transcription-repair coupling factor, partial [Acidimicrobiales bacterium]|nr:transcription-repair coupling factor [Acidimicrobiales bacterium]